ncbi:MAG: hypothetical protein FWG30_00195 [Eubacteriaceae bacterium]|nr:hypothetical protein [Eubacteriaceae bacterium]
MNISYLLRCAVKMDKKALFEQIEDIHQKTGKGRASILLDMQRCAVSHGAGYVDYGRYEMYSLSESERATFLTRGRNDALVKKYNKAERFHIFENKAAFNTVFEAYLKREWLDPSAAPKEEALEFISKHGVVFSKPVLGACGAGIERVSALDFSSNESCYGYLMGLGPDRIWEEQALQHEALERLYKGSINTVRAVTLTIDGQPYLVSAMLRIGNGSHIDNFFTGGMVAPVDANSGIVTDCAIDISKTAYRTHPLSGAAIKGVKIPDWREAVFMVKRASLTVPEMGYVGWDIAFTPDGPCLIEGNEYPGHALYQLPGHTQHKQGIMPLFWEIEKQASAAAAMYAGDNESSKGVARLKL